jgi:hypothetical protein
MAQFLLSPSQFPFAPLAVSLLLPFVPLSTYLAPSSCDRNRPPPSQVACKLTLFAPPFTQLPHPFQLPRTPTTQRLTMTTLGPFRSCYAEHCWWSTWSIVSVNIIGIDFSIHEDYVYVYIYLCISISIGIGISLGINICIFIRMRISM